ncbi:MAG: hypothetical protein PHX18_07435 [Candidatus Gastranaerophilales bacterium]|nr:hypothetical protein [Candidatus Gastranaerophilales bacterium]
MGPIILGEKSMKFVNRALKIAGPEQRLILGATAICSQPLIDYYNRNVDDKTRKYSVCRTVSKIIAGTVVGVSVRYLAIKYASRFIKLPDVTRVKPEVFKTLQDRSNLQKSLGDIIAIGVMLFTNFLIDAPLTKMGTNFLAKKFIKKDSPEKTGGSK